MARVTVEDCLENVSNIFELVLIASKRTRQLSKGADPLVPTEGDKVTVIALREIAAGLIDKSILEEHKIPLKIVAEEISEISQEIINETQQTEIEVEAEVEAGVETKSESESTPELESESEPASQETTSGNSEE